MYDKDAQGFYCDAVFHSVPKEGEIGKKTKVLMKKLNIKRAASGTLEKMK